MPLSSATGYTDLKRLEEMHLYEAFGRKTVSSGQNMLISNWRNPLSSGSTAGNVVCASTSLGSLWGSTNIPVANTTNLWLTEIEAHPSTVTVTSVSALLIDRLVQMDGLVMNVATTQTVNTTALTRSTDGIGNMIAVQVWTSGALTSVAMTVKYTNTAGTTGQVAPVVQVTGVVTNRMFIVPLAAGDLGVKAVEEVQLASSGTAAGNLGIIIFRPLAVFPIGPSPDNYGAQTEPYRNMFVGGGFAMSSVMSSACLDMITLAQAVAAIDIQYRLGFVESA